MEAAETWVCTLLIDGRSGAAFRRVRARSPQPLDRSSERTERREYRIRAIPRPRLKRTLGPEFKRIRLEELSEATLRHALALRDSSA